MTILTESTHAGEFCVSEANGSRSREAITVQDNETLVAGAVVGIVTATGHYGEYNDAAVDGLENAAGILFDAVTTSGAVGAGVVIARDAEYNLAEVTWKAAMSAQDKLDGQADMLALGLVAR